MPSPSVLVFDVNETLSDLAPMAGRFTDVGAPAALARLWFASVLRDGLALTAAGGQAPFAVVGEAALRTLLAGLPLDRPVDDAVGHVLAGFGALPVHPDVADAVRSLHDAGHRLVTLSNGAAAVAEGLLERAGIRDRFEAVLSVEDAGAWKPAPSSYRYAAARCGVDPGAMVLVAVHPWDVHGAARAGLATAWVDRSGTPYPGYLAAPSVRVGALTDLVGALRGGLSPAKS